MTCPDCEGKGFVERTGVHPSRDPGGVSAMEQPDCWTERCETCGGVGSVDDRREYERSQWERAWDEDERISNLAMNRGQTIRRMQAEIDELKSQIAALSPLTTGGSDGR